MSNEKSQHGRARPANAEVSAADYSRQEKGSIAAAMPSLDRNGAHWLRRTVKAVPDEQTRRKKMALTKKEQARYRAIVHELSRLSRNGWDRATHVDWELLEAELKQLGDKLIQDKPTGRRK